MIEYLPILVTMVFAVLIAALIVGASHILGHRISTKVKLAPYECGMPTIGPTRMNPFFSASSTHAVRMKVRWLPFIPCRASTTGVFLFFEYVEGTNTAYGRVSSVSVKRYERSCTRSSTGSARPQSRTSYSH